MIDRRGLITGLISLVAAPAIVRAGSLMPVKVMLEPEILINNLIVIDKIYYQNINLWHVDSNRVWISYDECLKMFPIPDEDI